ncbi:MAG: hypothetical protein KJ630_07730 [Proteobacteria bacterium]|nr:hypothetical protein [Pseudomonadota bacterium]
MNFHNPAQPYFRSRANTHSLQQLHKQKVFSLSRDRKVWFSAGKMLLVLCPMLLAVNLWLASSFNKLSQSVQVLENVQHELIESQITLRIKKDQLFSPERVRVIAAEKLALNIPEKEQVKVF